MGTSAVGRQGTSFPSLAELSRSARQSSECRWIIATCRLTRQPAMGGSHHRQQRSCRREMILSEWSPRCAGWNWTWMSCVRS